MYIKSIENAPKKKGKHNQENTIQPFPIWSINEIQRKTRHSTWWTLDQSKGVLIMAPFNFGKKDSSHWNPTIALSPKPAKQAKGGQSYTSSSAYACPEFSIPTWVHKWSKPLYQGIALGPYNTWICNRTSPGTVPSLPSPLHIYNTQIHCVHPNSQLECAHL